MLNENTTKFNYNTKMLTNSNMFLMQTIRRRKSFLNFKLVSFYLLPSFLSRFSSWELSSKIVINLLGRRRKVLNETNLFPWLSFRHFSNEWDLRRKKFVYWRKRKQWGCWVVGMEDWAHLKEGYITFISS